MTLGPYPVSLLQVQSRKFQIPLLSGLQHGGEGREGMLQLTDAVYIVVLPQAGNMVASKGSHCHKKSSCTNSNWFKLKRLVTATCPYSLIVCTAHATSCCDQLK